MDASFPKPDGQSIQNAEAFGSGAAGDAVAPLLPAHRTDLRGLDQALHPFPSDARARRPGRRGGQDRGVSERSGGERAGGPGDPEPSDECAGLLVQARAERAAGSSHSSGAGGERKANVPVVLTRAEVAKVLPFVEGVSHLVVKLLYGSGLRIMEALRLRVKDMDFEMKQITVRSGKGDKDRVTMRPHYCLVTGMAYNGIGLAVV